MRLRLSIPFLMFVFQCPLSAQLPSAVEVEEVIRRANDYFIANTTVGVANWNRGAYQTGNYAAWSVLGETRYRDRATSWAIANSWNLGRPYDGNHNHRLHADSQVAGQVYLDLYSELPLPERREAVAKVMQELVDNLAWNDGRSDTIDNNSADDWWWVDAYYMAAPTLARLANIDDAEIYRTQLRTMYDWMKETRALYDAEEGLWYRDAAAKTEISPGGQKVFWSRGNGWVMAGLARVLEQLPPQHPDRAEFVSMLQAMAAALVPLQGVDGFWRSSLLDSTHHPNPETSGTAFFTAAMAWGIRNGILDTETYTPVVAAAWNGLTDIALRWDGRVGYIQNVGRAPAAAGATETHDFGVGAFLLAGTEVLQLLGGAVPVLANAGPDQIKLAGEAVHEAAFTLDGSGTVLRQGTISSVSWWIGGMFLAEGMVAEVELPTGVHSITLRVEHSDGGIFEDLVKATLVGSTKEMAVISVSASSWEIPNAPANVIDGDLGTRWSAEGVGQWIQFDLGSVYFIALVDVAFYLGNSRTATFDITLSSDGMVWQPALVGNTSSGTTLGLQSFATGGEPARFVRIIGYGNSSNNWNSLTEVVIRQASEEVDVDGNGLPDAWELERLGAVAVDPDADTDGDGYSDLDEFIAGTDPLSSTDFPRPPDQQSAAASQLTLFFTARAAFGPGYRAISRIYTLESSTDLTPESWHPVEEIDPILGRNLPIRIDLPLQPTPRFFRLRAELVQNLVE